MKQTRNQKIQNKLDHLLRRHCTYCGRYRYIDKLKLKQVRAWNMTVGWYWKEDYICLQEELCELVSKKNIEHIQKKYKKNI